MAPVDKFSDVIAAAKRHTIGGEIDNGGMTGLLRRANTLGISEAEARRLIEATPAAPKVARHGLTRD